MFSIEVTSATLATLNLAEKESGVYFDSIR